MNLAQPHLVIGSPPSWTGKCGTADLRGMTRELQERARQHEIFCCAIYCLQLSQGRHFLHEQPWQAGGSEVTGISNLLRDHRIGRLVVDHCRFGLNSTRQSTGNESRSSIPRRPEPPDRPETVAQEARGSVARRKPVEPHPAGRVLVGSVLEECGTTMRNKVRILDDADGRGSGGKARRKGKEEEHEDEDEAGRRRGNARTSFTSSSWGVLGELGLAQKTVQGKEPHKETRGLALT